MNEIAYVIIGATIGALLALTAIKLLRRWKINKRMKKAKKGEVKAVDLLEKYGYQVLDTQKEAFYTLEIDEKPYPAKVKADFIVKKGNKTYVAEVKTGQKVSSPRNLDTRRQLLEYYLVYRPHGIILVDMESSKLRHVKYRFNKEFASMAQQISWVAVIFISGVVIGFLSRGG